MSRAANKRSGLESRFRWLGLTMLAFGGCSSFSPSDAALPAGAVRIAPHAAYGEWFDRTEACSGLRGQLDEIQWFVVPDVDVFETQVGPKVGMWEKVGGVARIIIAGRYIDHEMVVRHEMLHHLLDREGHPTEFFTGRCRLTWETWASVAPTD